MRRTHVLVCALTLGAAFAAAVPAGAQSTASLRAQLQTASSRLDRATEAYDQAHIKRASLDGKLTTARADVARSEQKLAAVRSKLGKAVRYMYMHPAGGMDSFYQARSFGELERGSAFAGRVVLSADDVVLQLRKARAEERASVANLQRLRDEARANELAMARDQRDAAGALARTKSLLANSELADQLNAERIAGLHGYTAANIRFDVPVSPAAQTAVRTAAAQIGKPYVWGGSGPDSFDCSGLTMYAWGHAGVSLPHSAAAQYESLPHVSLSDLAPGDLVFYGMPPHHVGIYIGHGVMIHAPQTGEVVHETSIYGMGEQPSGAARP